ncbi:MAG: hypothetical protein K1X68_11595 [Saprospiraceae bacterium]|nr:hypothetical protein [Saprospiraceae bacterium]HMW40218.1 hypothetical protein [Saprospiraceae bacterium]HMX87814.1 hypothetical protein [Saprospiraceae bacterium]HMZ39390.1 hypothetical protein [Saprospiraceae bacterium]HNA64536.1 hypothetical protein [Saprospiraceae bacterium]
MYQRSKYDHIISGIITGLIVPVLGFFLFTGVYELLDHLDVLNPAGLAPNFRERTIRLLAIILNVIPTQIFNKKNWAEAMRGMVFPTLLYVGLWMYFYGYELLNNDA